MAVDKGAVHHVDVIVGAAAFEQHVLAAGGDQRQPGDHPVIALGLPHFYLTQAVEPLGK